MRVKENRRNRFGLRPAKEDSIVTTTDDDSNAKPDGNAVNGEINDAYLLRMAGGEDVLGAARSIEKVRAAEGSVSSFEKSFQQQIPKSAKAVNMSGGGNSYVSNGSNSHNQQLDGLSAAWYPAPFYFNQNASGQQIGNSQQRLQQSIPFQQNMLHSTIPLTLTPNRRKDHVNNRYSQK